MAQATGSLVTATTFLFATESSATPARPASPLIDLSPTSAPSVPVPDTTHLVTAPISAQIPEVEYARNSSMTERRPHRPSTIMPFETSLETIPSANSSPRTSPKGTPLGLHPPQTSAQPQFSDLPAFELHGAHEKEPSGAGGLELAPSSRQLFAPSSPFFSTPASRLAGTFPSLGAGTHDLHSPQSFLNVSDHDSETTVYNSMTLSPMGTRGAIGSANRHREYLPAYPTLVPTGSVVTQPSAPRQARFDPRPTDIPGGRRHQSDDEGEGEEEEEEEEGGGPGIGIGGGGALSPLFEGCAPQVFDALKKGAFNVWTTFKRKPVVRDFIPCSSFLMDSHALTCPSTRLLYCCPSSSVLSLYFQRGSDPRVALPLSLHPQSCPSRPTTTASTRMDPWKRRTVMMMMMNRTQKTLKLTPPSTPSSSQRPKCLQSREP